ncbi:CoA transferase [Streptomyces sp. NPDC058001]|uniref:CoA transferase n=1 Tax=Streptomyces sp. NPDC058001 TaxID=3346300 RepID=UPI0036E72042
MGRDPGMAHAVDLLVRLGARRAPELAGADVVFDATGQVPDAIRVRPRHPDDDWAASGAMALTGRADGPPLRAPGAPASAARGALLAFEALLRHTGRDAAADALPGPDVLGERAALAGLSRRGPASAGGAFRLLPAVDGTLGLSLARPDDLDLLPALTEDPGPDSDPWETAARWAARTPADAARDRAALLGIPAAWIPPPGSPPQRDAQLTARWGPEAAPGPFRLTRLGAGDGLPRRPLVADLSSLWAGPLCAHLLGLSGARIVKVESTRRPDGARRGTPAFYELLHAGHESVAYDFTSAEGRAALRALLARADVVIEASRPRAMAQLGIDPRELAAHRPGLTWVSITAYGRTGPWSDRPGFGDDVAAAAGLVARDTEGPVPCGDALADPLTGLHAAVAALASLLGGGGLLVDVAMREVCLSALALGSEGVAPRDVPCAPPHVARRHSDTRGG